MNLNFFNEFKRLAFSFGILAILNKIFPLFLFTLISYRLGLENFGKYSFFLSILSFCELFIDFGFKNTALTFISNSKNSNLDISQILLIRFILFALIILTIIFFTDEANYVFYYVIYLLGVVFNVNWLYQLKKNMKTVVLIAFTAKFSYLILVYFLIQKNSDYHLFLLIFVSLYLIENLINFRVAQSLFNFKILWIFKYKHLYRLAKKGFFYFLASLSVYSYSSFNIIILNNFFDLKTLGLYSVCYKIVNHTKDLAKPLNDSIYPILISLRKSNPIKFSMLSKKYLLSLIIIFISLSSLIYFSNKIILSFFIDDSFSLYKAKNILSLLLISIPFSVYASFKSISLIIDDLHKIIFKATLFTGLISISLIYFISSLGNINMVAFSQSIIIVTLCLLLNFFNKRVTYTNY